MPPDGAASEFRECHYCRFYSFGLPPAWFMPNWHRPLDKTGRSCLCRVWWCAGVNWTIALNVQIFCRRQSWVVGNPIHTADRSGRDTDKTVLSCLSDVAVWVSFHTFQRSRWNLADRANLRSAEREVPECESAAVFEIEKTCATKSCFFWISKKNAKNVRAVSEAT